MSRSRGLDQQLLHRPVPGSTDPDRRVGLDVPVTKTVSGLPAKRGFTGACTRSGAVVAGGDVAEVAEVEPPAATTEGSVGEVAVPGAAGGLSVTISGTAGPVRSPRRATKYRKR
jgi:hypothetical protein